MKPTVESLLQRGYFPKELPPPFNTFSFGAKNKEIKDKFRQILASVQIAFPQYRGESVSKYKKRISEEIKVYNSSVYLKYSITKGRLSRRYIGIPNPLHYLNLAVGLADTWDNIIDTINRSPFSQSKPLYTRELYKRSFTTSCRGLSDFRKSCLDVSFDKKVELKIDISRFYPSIYTHSIPWALLGKGKSKAIFNLSKEERKRKIEDLDIDCITYEKADNIDTLIRNCQGKQTVGIPIGSDISFIVAELICSRIDCCIKEHDNGIVGCRFYDDYYLYTDTLSDAEDILKYIHGILDDFGLSINEEKTQIRQFPFEFEDQFSIDLSKFELKNNLTNNIRLYFNLIWKFANENPLKMGQIFRYGLRRFDPLDLARIKLEDKDWKTFEDLLFKTMILDPSILDIACRILVLYSTLLTDASKERLTKIVRCIFKDHISLKQDLEVSWALWLCKRFNLVIIESDCIVIFRMENAISSLILLDIINSRPELKDNTLLREEIEKISHSFTEKSFFDESWLLLYEGILKGWINRTDLIEKNLFFKILYDFRISFYDMDIDVDFSSSDYLLSRQESVIASVIRENAVEISENLCEEIFEIKAQEIKDRDSEYDDIFDQYSDLDEIKDGLKEEFDEDILKQKIYNSVLFYLLNGEPVNKEEIISEYLAELANDVLSY